MNTQNLGFQTRSIHYGYHPLDDRHGSVSPPLYMTSTFAFENIAHADSVVAEECHGYYYGRQHNPTQTLLEQRIANLENAEEAVTAASGIAALSAMFFSLLSPGDEIIVHQTLYSNTSALLDDGLAKFGIKIIKVDLSSTEKLINAINSSTKMVFFETPVNPTGEVLDIFGIASVAHQYGLCVAVDSTYASPSVQRPLEHGADVVMHSLTKYINGHGDMLGGIVAGRSEIIHKVRGIGLRYLNGAAISPMACFLALRGLKTLKIRIEQHSQSALTIATMLAEHPAVRVVRYPFLPGSPGYVIAKKQMESGSGMISFELKSGYEGAVRMLDKLNLISRAVSLGDTESLIMHPGSLLQARRKIYPSAKLSVGVSMDLIRLSVGLEDVEDIIGDLKQAID